MQTRKERMIRSWTIVDTHSDTNLCPFHRDHQDICCCHWNNFADHLAQFAQEPEATRTYYVAGDTDLHATYATIGAARRRADLLWHRDVLAFPATIGAYDSETQESHEVESYHPGPFTFA